MKKSYNYFIAILGFFARLLFTIAIEIGIAFAFGYKHKDQFSLIVFVNVLTQIALNIFLSITLFKRGAMAFRLSYVIAEIIIFALEAVIYGIVMNKIGPKHKTIKNVGYALVSNGISLGFGLLLSFIFSLIPNIAL